MTSPIISTLTRKLTYELTAPLGTIMGQGSQPTIPVDPAKLDARKVIMPTFCMPGGSAATVMGPGLTHACSRMYTRSYGKIPEFIQLVWFNKGLINNYPGGGAPLGEFLNINDVMPRASVQNNANSNWVKCTFNGDPAPRFTPTTTQADPLYISKLLPPGAIMCDPIHMSTAAVADGSGGLGFSTSQQNMVIKIKTDFGIDADTGTVITGWQSADTQDQILFMSAANAADQVWGTGDFVPGTGDIVQASVAPSLIIGGYRNNDGSLAVGIFGDSIAQYFNDTRFHIRSNTGGGMYNSACRGTLLIPCANLALSSQSPISYSAAADTTIRDWAVRFFHVLIEENGTNAISSAPDPNDMVSWVQTRHIIAKQSGVLHTAICTIIPNTTSTDVYATEANQTPRTAQGDGGIADQYNNLIRAKVGKWDFFDTLLDNEAAVCGVNNRKWGSPDYVSSTSPAGIHPTGTAAVGTEGGGQKRMRDAVIIPYLQSLPTPTFTTP